MALSVAIDAYDKSGTDINDEQKFFHNYQSYIDFTLDTA